ncbi:nuclear transport factor 2 family protein [Telluria mixta]|uniref:Nuclear transport factor 2 family protein n=1 Tax=Telluria mixta TaxID=34071 RepID=A0ABT2BZ92_9BURK|nr:nuclear transport factor 2 family protein [Telluria mixta]MCS0630257.1 nuclear transport factor 2 family protein [Telluria mixta]WEM94434.1 nuclear transport factor 2 family protein [Telluria mixta]
MRYQNKLAAALAAAALCAPQAHAADATDANRALMRAFVDTAYVQKQVRKAYEAYVAPDLVQHNPNIADGREAAIAEIEGLLKHPAARFDVKHVVVDGDMATVHFRGSLGNGMSAAVVELFRLRDGRIVEHWDAFQVIDPNAQARNPHPYF